jgi:hypothetical protein
VLTYIGAASTYGEIGFGDIGCTRVIAGSALSKRMRGKTPGAGAEPILAEVATAADCPTYSHMSCRDSMQIGQKLGAAGVPGSLVRANRGRSQSYASIRPLPSGSPTPRRTHTPVGP